MQLPDFPSREMSVQEVISVLLGVAVVVAAAVADVVVTAKKLCLCYLFKCQQLEFHEIIIKTKMIEIVKKRIRKLLKV